jgi:choline monooxygenase
MPEFFVDKNIARAKTINTAFYNSPEIFELSKEKIFASSWQFIGSSKKLGGENNAYPFTMLENYLDEPLLLTKDEDDKIHLVSNVCTHRGNLITERPCSVANLRCRYHGRKFDLDGKFISMPEFKEVQDFPTEEDDLKQLKIFHWSQWMFSSLNEKFSPEVFFGDMIERVQWMPLDQFKFHPELSREFKVSANWALYCENYLEGFHIPFVHSDLNAVIDFGEYATELFFPYSSLQLGIAKNNNDCFDLPPSSPDYGKNIAAYYFWVFPNMMFNFYPWGLSVNIVKPVSPGECKVVFQSFVWDESKLNKGAGAGLDKVEKEDEEIVENVQKGIRSRFYKYGRYSVTREQGTHHFHRILAEFLK